MSSPFPATVRGEACPLQTAQQDPAVSREIVRLENITKTYHLGEADVPALRGVSLSIARGEMVALMGASGSGKTTLMNILGCLDRPSSGQFWFDGREMSLLSPNERALVRTARLGFVFQSFNLLPRTSALHNILMPLDYALRRPARNDARRLAETLLEQVGLATRMSHEPSQMSGGQQQRVAVARALVNRPALLLADEPTGNLDSQTGDEILRMFQWLNARGITVIIVTHDARVAACADRTIRIADGRITEDSGRRAGKAAEASGLPAETAPPPAPRQSCAGSLLPSTLRTAVGNLRRHAMRSLLTALGVIIGVGAVIAMTEIGEGTKVAIAKALAVVGANKLLIAPGAAANSGVSQGAGTFQTLTPGDDDEIARQCPALSVVVPMVSAQAQAIYGKRNWFPRKIEGTAPGYLAVRDWEDLEEGSNFTDDDVRGRHCVCLIGATIRRELFWDQSPVGKTIRLRNVPFRIIGLLRPLGASMAGYDQDDTVVAPWTTIKFRLNSLGAGSTNPAAAAPAPAINTLNNLYAAPAPLYPQPSPLQLADTPQPVRQASVDVILAKAASREEVPAAIEQIAAVLRQRHHFAENDDFQIVDMIEAARVSAEAAELMGALLLAVAAISLVAGGVGIMNIMLVSVTERTREIGLRMAVGARRHHILQLFLVEAVLLCLFGGALGILVGRGTSILVRQTQHWTTGSSLPAIAVSVLIAAGVGLVFGFYPAWNASRLDPIEALKHE